MDFGISGCHKVPAQLVPICKLLFLVGMLNPAHMILGFLSSSLSTGPKLLGVESGFNSPDLPSQLLLDATLLNKLQTRHLSWLPVIDLTLSVLF